MKVHIIGRGEGWDKAPGSQPGWETWGLNTVVAKRDVDLALDIHNDLDGKNHNRQTSLELIAKIVERVNELKIPFYTCKVWEHIPTSVKYPLFEIIKHFNTDFFGGGVDYLTALAMFKGATHINYWGINYLGRSDYIKQLPSGSFWVGGAHFSGIKVNINGSEHSNFIRTLNRRLYGFNIPQCQSWS